MTEVFDILASEMRHHVIVEEKDYSHHWKPFETPGNSFFFFLLKQTEPPLYSTNPFPYLKIYLEYAIPAGQFVVRYGRLMNLVLGESPDAMATEEIRFSQLPIELVALIIQAADNEARLAFSQVSKVTPSLFFPFSALPKYQFLPYT